MDRDLAVLDDRIALLEKTNSSSRKKNSEIDSRLIDYDVSRSQKEQALRDQYAGLRVTVDKLREDAQAINGRLEEIEYAINRKSDSDRANKKRVTGLDTSVTKNSDRLAKLEEYLGLEIVKKSDIKSAMKKSANKKKLSQGEMPEQELYARSKKKFDQGDFEGAINGFQTYLDKFPKSKNADNAQFWTGEIFYKEKWYEKAILEYQKVIINYPKGNKVPAAYLKQGLSFHNLDEKANARLVLNELIRKFPESNEAGVAKKKLKGYK